MTRRFRAVLCASGLIAALLVPQTAAAQAKQGDKEIQVAGNISTTYLKLEFPGVEDDTITTSTGTIFFGLGYFLTDRLQLGVAPSISVSGSSGIGTSSINFDVGLFTNLQYFLGAADAKVKPYVGYSLQILTFDAPEGTSFGDNAYNAAVFGVKNYFSERAALDLNGSYGFLMSGPGNGQSLNFRVGITYLF